MAKGRPTTSPIHPLLAEIDRVREEAGISRTEFAARAGFTSPSLSRIMNGKVSPTLETVTRLCDALNVQTILVRKEGDIPHVLP